jgi:hypothetical protein
MQTPSVIPCGKDSETTGRVKVAAGENKSRNNTPKVYFRYISPVPLAFKRQEPEKVGCVAGGINWELKYKELEKQMGLLSATHDNISKEYMKLKEEQKNSVPDESNRMK